MSIALTVLAVVVVVLLTLLAMPLTIAFRLDWPATAGNVTEVRWAFGLVRFRGAALVSTASKPKPVPSTNRKPQKAPARRLRRNDFARGIAAARDSALRRRALRFVAELWRAVHKDDVRLRLRIGLADPADTGRLWALLGPASGVLAQLQTVSVVVHPDFGDERFEFDGSGRVRVMPIEFLWIALGLVASPAVWRGLWRLRTV